MVAWSSAVIVRVDSHTVIAPDYVDAAIATLSRSGADVVGGPMRPVGDTPVGAGATYGTDVEILAGLKAGDVVAVFTATGLAKTP